MSTAHIKSLMVSLPMLVAATGSAASTATPPPAQAEAQLRAINHRFVQAFAIADPGFMERLTARDFLLIGTRGDWVDRAAHLEAMRKPAAPGSVSYDDVRVRLFGDMALLHGLFEASAATGPALRIRYTDVYQWSAGAWQLVSAQNTPLREGVPRQQVFGAPQTIAPWKGEDPSGDDEAVLRELNAHYVRAFRDADVNWYNAHLSADYIVIGGDGSIKDRAQALADFAKPTFAIQMKSFPVDQVQIRRFGDLALIHAQNAYELKDGRRGVSRYTDIWHRQADGRWLCVAAHITTHQAPV